MCYLNVIFLYIDVFKLFRMKHDPTVGYNDRVAWGFFFYVWESLISCLFLTGLILALALAMLLRCFH